MRWFFQTMGAEEASEKIGALCAEHKQNPCNVGTTVSRGTWMKADKNNEKIAACMLRMNLTNKMRNDLLYHRWITAYYSMKTTMRHENTNDDYAAKLEKPWNNNKFYRWYKVKNTGSYTKNRSRVTLLKGAGIFVVLLIESNRQIFSCYRGKIVPTSSASWVLYGQISFDVTIKILTRLCCTLKIQKLTKKICFYKWIN